MFSSSSHHQDTLDRHHGAEGATSSDSVLRADSAESRSEPIMVRVSGHPLLPFYPTHSLSYLLTLSRSSGNIVSRSDQVSDSPTGLLAYAPVAPDMDISQSVGIPTLNHAQDQVLPTQDGNNAAPNNIDRALRACTNCVRAKTKCSPSLQGGGKCQRYHARRLVLYYVYVVTMV